MSRRVNIVLLCEDIQQQVFFRRLLQKLGHGNRNIRQVPLPVSGSAEQYVRTQYPVQVKSIRPKLTHSAYCLVVAVDADRSEVQHRYAQLDGSLMKRGLPGRQPHETIAVFVPKWHIETWIHYLLHGGPVSEDEPSTRFFGHETDCYPAVERFIALARHSDTPGQCPPSLKRGLNEAPRVPNP